MKIRIIRFNGGLHISPAPVYLTKFLKYRHKSLELVAYKRKPVFKEVLLHEPDGLGEGGILTLQGFYKQVCALIEKKGDTYSVVDNRTALPDPDWEAIKSLSPRDYQIEPIVEVIQEGTENSGVILATGGWGKTYAQAFVYAAWNKLNTILAIPIKQVAIQTHKKFQALFPEKHIGFVGDGKCDISKDITISTFKSMHKCAIEKCELLLVDEIQSCTAPGFQAILSEMKPHRIFGFTATDDGLFNNADKLLTGLFGERLVNIPYDDAKTIGAVVPCIVYFLPVGNQIITAKSMEGVMSQGIKESKQRNGLIAKVCASVPEGWSTLTFVDHVEDHLISLYKLMPPHTKFIHRDSDKKRLGAFALTSKQQNEVIDEFSNNKFQHLIATDAFRAGVDIPHLRVVIQAAGGCSKVEVLQEAFRGSRTLTEEYKKKLNISEDKTHFILVDFLDEHDDMLHNMALKRMEYYKEQGWEVREVNSVKDINWRNTNDPSGTI